MKNKTVIFILIIAVVAIIGFVGFYFIQKNKLPISSVNNATLPEQDRQNNQVGAEQPQNKLVTDDFEIIFPSEWRQTTPPIGVSAMAVNSNEQINDAAAQKINFKSYVAVSYDTLQEKSLSEYLQVVKNQLQQTISNVVFAQERDTTINGRTARAIEANLTQQGVNFKILMVAIQGVGDDVWVISFNTLQNSWMEYQEIFPDIANSFKLKK